MKKIDMCNGPLFGKILMFAFPLMCANILQILFNTADVIIVGRFAGPNSLAAVGSTTALINMLVAAFIGLSVGANAVAARNLGANKEEAVKKTVHTAIVMSIVSGFILSIVGITFAKTLLTWMSTPADVIDLSANYLRVYFLGMPALMLYNFGSALLRAAGDTKRPLKCLVIAGILNVCLNLIFVIVFKLDVVGVGAATAISQYVSAFLIIRYLCREEGALQLRFSNLGVDGKIFGQIVRIGLPAGLQGSIFSLSNVVIQSAVNSFGSVVMAGNSAAYSLESFIYVTINAFHHTGLTFNSQNLGAGKYKRLDKVTGICVGMSFSVGCVMCAGLFAAAGPLLSIYSTDAAVIQAGIVRIAAVGIFYELCGIMDTMPGCLRGMGYSFMPMLVSLLGACAFRLVWVATIFRQYHDIEVLYVSYPISWVLTFSVHIICFLIIRKKLQKNM